MNPPNWHPLPSMLTGRRVVVHVAGAGGTGSQLLTALARLHVALRALDPNAGLDLTLFDPDRVSRANIGRQLFSPCDVGLGKAAVLVNRINAFFGLDWRAETREYDPLSPDFVASAQILVTCVDTAAARRAIGSRAAKRGASMGALWSMYWLDCGNSQKSGQVFLTQFAPVSGESSDQASPRPMPQPENRLPPLSHWLPEIFDSSIPEDNAPSCSLAEALENQDLFINQAVATWAAQLLWSFFRNGGIDTCGYWINLAAGRVSPVPVPEGAPEPTPGKRAGKAGKNG